MSNETSNVVKANLGGQNPFQSPYMGRFTHNLDPKKRLTVPSVWRNQVGEGGDLFLMPGLGRRCLMLMTGPSMQRFLEKMQSLHISDPEQMDLMLTLASESDHLSFDAQGRIRVKDEHLEYAGLTGEVILAGAFYHIELWNPEEWAKRRSSAPSLATAAQSLQL